MHEAWIVQLIQTLQQLSKQVPNQVVTHLLIHFDEAVQLPILRKVHHIEAHMLFQNSAAVVWLRC